MIDDGLGFPLLPWSRMTEFQTWTRCGTSDHVLYPPANACSRSRIFSPSKPRQSFQESQRGRFSEIGTDRFFSSPLTSLKFEREFDGVRPVPGRRPDNGMGFGNRDAVRLAERRRGAGHRLRPAGHLTTRLSASRRRKRPRPTARSRPAGSGRRLSGRSSGTRRRIRPRRWHKDCAGAGR